jgi:hypothetical protein
VGSGEQVVAHDGLGAGVHHHLLLAPIRLQGGGEGHGEGKDMVMERGDRCETMAKGGKG